MNIIVTMSVCRSSGYTALDDEFQVSDADWKWLLAHTEYNESELQAMLNGTNSWFNVLTLQPSNRLQRGISRRRYLQTPV